MKKHSGFTLIELMVVMAIIAILATAGLSAYTGYIKKARDSVRIADVDAINKIVMASMTTTGMPPQTADEVHDLIVSMNNGKGLFDPLSNQGDGSDYKNVCLPTITLGETLCIYTYRVCDGGLGYAVGANLESSSNRSIMGEDGVGASYEGGFSDDSLYELGSCKDSCEEFATTGCPTQYGPNSCPTLINDAGDFVFPCT